MRDSAPSAVAAPINCGYMFGTKPRFPPSMSGGWKASHRRQHNWALHYWYTRRKYGGVGEKVGDGK